MAVNSARYGARMEFSERFSECYVALIALLWAELDQLLCELNITERDCAVQQRAQAMLLELVLLRECAARETFRIATAPTERAAYCSLIDDVWKLLDFQPTALPSPGAETAVQRAQDRLLLEVERVARVAARCSTSLAACTPAPRVADDGRIGSH
jgi:hypothetical protein